MTRFVLFVSCWTVLVGAARTEFAEEPKADTKNLRGTWVATSAERNGAAAAEVVGHRIAFTKQQFVIHSPKGELLYEGTFRVDSSQTPSAIDFEHTKGMLKGKVWKGIYSVQGDTLRICDNAPNMKKDRPTGFRTKPDSGYVSIAFRRLEKDKPR